MGEIKLILPKMGESVAEATLTSWLKNEGDRIALDEAVAEIATDKVDSEIPATHEGILKKQLFKVGEIVKVGQAFAIIEIEGNGDEEAEAPEVQKAETKKASTPIATNVEKKNETIHLSKGDRFYSPLVRSIAQKEGISKEQLDKIEGSGKEGRVTKDDILAFLENKETSVPATAPVKQSTPASEPAPSYKVVSSGEDEIIEMDRMRKLIAEHMVKSKQIAPHVTSFVEVDVTSMVLWRDKVKNEFEKREGFKITFTPIFIEAVAKAIKDFPMVNVQVDGTNIIKKRAINIGMATALPSGNLIVPVIKNADRLNIIGLSEQVSELSKRARENKLKPDEIQGGTFTITNVGTFGNVMGTPIINQPQVAILSTGIIKKKPVVIETPMGDSIAIRHMMFLSLSYDHRVVDGMLGGSFLRKIGDYLENFDINRVIW
ncbi:MAG: dihydrolipoamide acetyltransferase family protein [Bacteroidetes bacterium]|nr:dihydrolipoamide acetyltransferase family protein [Bacteroidota bacterium]